MLSQPFVVEEMPAPNPRVVRRILTPEELGIAQGWPVRPEFAEPITNRPARCCSWCPPSTLSDTRIVGHMFEEMGNTQNIAHCMAFYFGVLLCVERLDQAMM